MSKPKAKTVKAWVAVQSYRSMLLWSVASTSKEVSMVMRDNAWLDREYRIARIEIREVAK